MPESVNTAVWLRTGSKMSHVLKKEEIKQMACGTLEFEIFFLENFWQPQFQKYY